MKVNNCSNIGFGSNVKFIYKDGFDYLYNSKAVSEQLNKIKNDQMDYDVLLKPVSGSAYGPEGIFVRIMDSVKNAYSETLAQSRDVLYDNGIIKAYESTLKTLNEENSIWKGQVPQNLLTKDFLI